MSTPALVVTGMGAVSPLGLDVLSLSRSLSTEEPEPIRETPDFAHRLTLHQARRLDRLSQLVVVAAAEAAAQARLDPMNVERMGLVVGTGLGCTEKTWAQLLGITERGLAHADPMGFPDSMDNAPAAHAAMALGCRGPSLTLVGREISGEIAVMAGALLLRSRSTDAVVVVAGDAASPTLRKVVRRFAPDLPVGEGAGALVLETEDSASRRGARILGRLLGYAQSQERPGGSRLRAATDKTVGKACSAALAMAALSHEDVRTFSSESLRPRIGWLMADGIVRAIAGLVLLERDGRAAALVPGRARGGAAAALVLGA